MRRMHRYMVGLDGAYAIELTSDPVAFGSLPMSAGIKFWAEYDDTVTLVPRAFIIVGTGHPIPENGKYVGTTPRTPEGLVWHLYELDYG